MIEKEIKIENEGAPEIRADLRTESPDSALPVIILCHGFLGFKSWGWFPLVSRELARAGFHVITFSFSMNGIDEKNGTISRSGEFSRNTVSRELKDMRQVLTFVENSFPFPARADSVGLFGHSRGGAVAILTAAENSRVKSLVTWSTPSRLDRYTESRKEDWRRTGRLIFRGGKSENPLFLHYSYYLDIDANREKFDLPRQVERVDIPHLIIQGQRDAAVTLREARELTGRTGTNSRVRFEVIKGAGHTFGVRHPMISAPPRELSIAMEKTEEWFCDTMDR